MSELKHAPRTPCERRSRPHSLSPRKTHPATPPKQHSKGQDTNQVLFGGGSLAQQQQQTLDRVKETADKGIKIDV